MLSKEPFPSDEAKSLLAKFFNQTNANEISETLSVLLDAHIAHGDFDRLGLANTVNLINRLSQLAFNLENLQTREAAKSKKPISEFQTN